MIPDITPWSYPNRKTPKDTNIVVKYLHHISTHSARILESRTHINGLPVRPWIELVPSAMMAARARSAHEIRLGGGSGIQMDSLSTRPGWRDCERLRADESESW